MRTFADEPQSLVQRDSRIETEPLTRVPMVERVKEVSRSEVDARERSLELGLNGVLSVRAVARDKPVFVAVPLAVDSDRTSLFRMTLTRALRLIATGAPAILIITFRRCASGRKRPFHDR